MRGRPFSADSSAFSRRRIRFCGTRRIQNSRARVAANTAYTRSYATAGRRKETARVRRDGRTNTRDVFDLTAVAFTTGRVDDIRFDVRTVPLVVTSFSKSNSFDRLTNDATGFNDIVVTTRGNDGRTREKKNLRCYSKR